MPIREVPRRSVFIATTPRSGSWLLAEGLRGLGVAGQPEEYFGLSNEPLYRSRWGIGASAPYVEVIRRVLVAGQTRNGVFAAKFHWFQLTSLLERLRSIDGVGPIDDAALLRRYFGEFRVVHLQRRDTLRQAVSWHRAIVTDKWWRFTGAPAQSNAIEYNFEATKHLYYLLEDYKVYWRDWLSKHAPDALTICYEDLAADYPSTLRAVVRYLKLHDPGDVPPPTLARQADRTSEAHVRAYQQSWARAFGPAISADAYPS
jgi:LPS sulfotransferase NodH